MKKEIRNDRPVVFLESARVVPEAELAAIPNKKRAMVHNRTGVWVQVDCSKDACWVDKDTISAPRYFGR